MEATEPVRPPESSSERTDPAPFWDITKASFAVQVFVRVFTVIGVAAGVVMPGGRGFVPAGRFL